MKSIQDGHLRDLGRFSQMVLQGGLYNGQQIAPAEWIEDIRHGGDPQAWKKGPEYPYFRTLSGYENGSYRSYWYVADPRRGHFTAIVDALAGRTSSDPRTPRQEAANDHP